MTRFFLYGLTAETAALWSWMHFVAHFL